MIPAMGLTPLEIVRHLPKTNCGECGEPSCLAFAVALLSGKRNPRDCPHADLEGLSLSGGPNPSSELDQAWRILEEVKTGVAGLDLRARAGGLGVEWREGRLLIPYLDGLVELTPRSARRIDGLELDPRDQILLYNYVRFGGKAPLSGEFVGLETFPNSVSKVATLRRYAEERLARALSERFATLREALSSFRTREIPAEADLSFEVYVLPRVPLRIHFWRPEPEEGLSPEAKVLYDRLALEYLDLESLVFCAERFTERWLEVAGIR